MRRAVKIDLNAVFIIYFIFYLKECKNFLNTKQTA